MASTEGFLTEEQRETLKIATQNAEVLSSSPKSPTSLLSEHYLKVPAGGKAPNVGIAVRHVRRSHSGKLVRVKKGEFSTYMQFFYMVISYLGFRRLIKFLSIFDHFLCFYQTFYIFVCFFGTLFLERVTFIVCVLLSFRSFSSIYIKFAIAKIATRFKQTSLKLL